MATDEDIARISAIEAGLIRLLADQETVVILLAEFEKKQVESAVSPIPLALVPSVPAVPPQQVQTPESFEQVAAANYQAESVPLGHRPLVQSMLGMLPWDAQAVLAPVLNSLHGIKPWKVIGICSGALILGLATGMVAIPHTILLKAKEMHQTFSCPEPAKIPVAAPMLPGIPTPSEVKQ